MKTVLAVLLALSSPAALACDKLDAAKLQLTMSEMGAVWSERDGSVSLEWGRAWDGTAPGRRLGLLQAFAEGDACLAGRARPIAFYRQGRLVGSASQGAGVQLHDPVSTAAAAPVACP